MTLIADATELPATGRLMGLDHGSKTIGIAITDVERRMAQPVTTIRKNKFSVDMAELNALIATHQPAALIIGYPLNVDGSEGPRCQSVRAFVRNMEDHCDLPMLLWDERHSSQEADKIMMMAAMSSGKRKTRIDSAAATVILESFLED